MVLPTTTNNASSVQQVRLSLRRETVARLLALQAQAVKIGLRKPTYSQLIDAAVAEAADQDPSALLQGGGSW